MPAVIRTTAHVAALDPVSGFGLMACPASGDVTAFGSSLHWSDFEALALHLDSIGWEVVEDFDGLPASAGHLPDGRQLLSLAAVAPIDARTDDARLVDVAHEVMSALMAA